MRFSVINPKALDEHEFIFVAIDYFTEWVEAASYANLKKVQVTRFIKNIIFFGYGLPQSIIIDNAKHHNNDLMDATCAQFKIFHHNSASY